jgi:hypothetical protein
MRAQERDRCTSLPGCFHLERNTEQLRSASGMCNDCAELGEEAKRRVVAAGPARHLVAR